LYYSSFAIQEQAQKGTKDNSAHWDYKLSPVYVVGILDFMMEDTARRAGDIITKVHLKDEHNEVFNENLNFIFIEMPKFRKTESELVTIMDKWLYAIKNLGKLDDKPVALTEAIFNRFFEVAEIAAFSKTERYDYEENLKNYTDWFNVLNTAKKEGLVEGRAEGIAEGRAVGLAEGLEEGKAIGLKKGRAEGEAIGVQKGRAEGEHALLTKLVLSKQEKGKSPSEIAEMLEIDIKVVEDILGNTSNKGKIEL
jgi:predicted transposase/invertase (TIGR01784 family)